MPILITAYAVTVAIAWIVARSRWDALGLDDFATQAFDPPSWRHGAAVVVAATALAAAALGSRSRIAGGFLIGLLIGAIVVAPDAIARAVVR